MDEKEQDLEPQREPEEKAGEKKGLSRKGRVAVAVAAAVVAVALGGYLGLCAAAGGDKALPGTRVGGTDVGGMTREQVDSALAQLSVERFENLVIPIQVGERTVSFSAREAGVHVVGDAAQIVSAGKESFLGRGWNYLAGLFGVENPASFSVQVDDAGYLEDVLAQAAQAVEQPVEQFRWELEEDEETARLILHRGRTGQSVEQEALRQALMDALGRGDAAPIQAQIATTAPDEPDFAALAGEIAREPENATLNVETDEIVPHKLGLSLDAAMARERFAALAEGEDTAVELTVQIPEITTLALRAALYHDLLGEATSTVSGTANRVHNVELAASLCNGKVLLPGEQFSYLQAAAPFGAAQGYRMATGYSAQGTVDMIGGGVCQPSSTLYLACLRADLEIVTRANHRYTVSYMPLGMDATVSYPTQDYVFANNTPYPIKIEMTMTDRVLTARIHGTKTTDTYVEMESVPTGSTPYNTIYQADPSVPQGTTKTVMPPHTGRSAQVYKKIFAADGTLISRTLISRNTYQKCDKIVAYNPLDGAPDGSVAPVTDPDASAAAPDPDTGLPAEPGTETQDAEPGTEPGLEIQDTGDAEPSPPPEAVPGTPDAEPSASGGEAEPAPEVSGASAEPVPEGIPAE